MGLGNSLQTAQAGGAGGIGGWVELARTTLGSTNAAIDVTSLPDKRYYMLLTDIRKSASLGSKLGINGLTSTTYSQRKSLNGAADGTDVSQANWFDLTATNADPGFNILYCANKSDKEKLVNGWRVDQSTAGAGTAPTRGELAYKNSTTSATIDQFTVSSTTSTYASGSELVVLGWDPADEHTTNFWEELASVNLSGGSATSLSSGTFTAKKYLWVQIYSKRTSTGTQQPTLKVGNGTVATGSPYSFRYSNDGASDLTGINLDKLPLAWLGANKHFTNIFIINNASNEKLVIAHDVANVTTGAGSAPQRVESVSKYADTSNQINIIELHDWDGYTFDTQTTMKVWGSN
jgi:hypothetical protein